MHPRIQLVRQGRPLHEQLIQQLRTLVLEGGLPPGTRLPATREAARELQVSRNVIVLAYEQLSLEGFLEARVGSGTRVRKSLPAHLLQPQRPLTATDPRRELERASLSRQGERMAHARRIPIRCGGVPGPFLPGVVGPNEFPTRLWASLHAKVCRTRISQLVSYGEGEGYGPLREVIAAHAQRYRAVQCTAEQVIVTSGSQQALDLAARMLLDPQDPVAIEDPGYRGAQVAFAAAGATLRPVDIDAEGIVFPVGSAESEGVRLLYTTPSHQYPIGVTMSLERRLRLLEWAAASDAWIVEDDYDSEFRYESRPLPSLQGLDSAGRVIYVGTLSKVLAPGLRLGYLILPDSLVEAFRVGRSVLDAHCPLILQATLAEFIGQGHLERHVARFRGIYSERRAVIKEALEAELGGLVETIPSDAGLHITALLPPEIGDRQVSILAAREGVEAPALSDYSIRRWPRPGLVLGYGAVHHRQIPDGIRRIAKAVELASRPARVAGADREGDPMPAGRRPRH